MRKSASIAEAPWTYRDEVLSYTCQLAALLENGGDPAEVEEVLAPFPGRNVAGERFWASGPVVVSDFRALGDGSWSVSTPFVFGTGALGVGLVAGSLAGSAVARSRARRNAAAAATPRWVPIENGALYLSEHGFHLYTPQVHPWSWGGITGAAMVAPAVVHVAGNSKGGPVSWLLQSDWAELLFVSWAHAVHPRHPQLVTGQWLPPGWVEHARRHRQVPGNALPAGSG
ncbi:hypothetical protein [Amycolatopsis jejuensis]|uniref:hypothetical protein n=1 Tax=Amycolatopsis jejuensis TaxID=330084 RepID=UPI0012E027D6|nr:hypothetical protein [Amycolatopsis jejuensis]